MGHVQQRRISSIPQKTLIEASLLPQLGDGRAGDVAAALNETLKPLSDSAKLRD